jgi:hypothetical protein
MAEKLGPVSREVIARNLAKIRARMADAAARAKRSPDDVRLIAVTKYVSATEVETLIDLGVKDIGENRIQEAETKKAAIALKPGVYFHLIGHLQTNKADKAIALFNYVHSIDSERVASALNKEALKAGVRTIPCLLEVNVAGEANKFGIKPDADAISELIDLFNTLPALKVDGLMAMAPFAENPEPTSRPVFSRLRELRDVVAKRTGVALPQLSMGMTQDFDIAIEEGATMVRVGSALFES